MKKIGTETIATILSNEALLDYDYESALKDELASTRMKMVALEDSKHITEIMVKNLKKWLSKTIDECDNADVVKGLCMCRDKIESLERGE